MNTGRLERGIWSSRIGFILAGAGSAIGLGNIWRFPTTAGQYGGGAFVSVYLASVVFVCLAALIAELALGRHTGRNPVGAFKQLAPGSPWRYLGLLGVATGWGISSFYSVVAGWTLGYVFKTAGGGLSNLTAGQIEATFTDFVGNPIASLGLHAVFILMTMLVLFGGVKAGIERWCKILMPVLLVVLALLVIRSLTLPGAGAGLRFYLSADWGSLHREGVLAAVGQAFFSLSLGMGAMITYGSYLARDASLAASAAWVAGLDTLIALVAGLAIMPAIFAFDLDPASGAGLLFVVLPNVFNKIPLGNLFGMGFFILLGVAALTSLISIVEVPVAYFIDELGMSRRKAVLIAGGGALLAGVPSALDTAFLDGMNIVFGQYSLIVGSLGVVIFVGWRWGAANANAEIARGATGFHRARLFSFLIRFVAPAAIVILLIGLIVMPQAF